jgi:predicted TIM-barrel fold metal-dependent hydrolase
MKRLPWIHSRKRSEPEVPYDTPIPLGDKSNGEFYHEQTPYERRLRKMILQRGDENARRLGMDRREFMASTMGMATTLACINVASGCSSSKDGTAGDRSPAGHDGGGDGGYQIPHEAMYDADAAFDALGGKEFIFDLQSHHVEDEEHWREAHPSGTYIGAQLANFLSFADCGSTEKIQCIDSSAYVKNIFLESDTTVAVLSGFPAVALDADGGEGNHPISNVDMVHSRDRVNTAADSQRMVNHCQVAPNDRWELASDLMDRIHEQYGNWGWKVYTPWAPDGGGWWLDDPNIADPFLQKTIDLGNPLVCAHKGFPLPTFNETYTDPKDVGPAAVKWPEITFVIYHSAFASESDTGPIIGPYDENDPAPKGVNRLVRTVLENDLTGKNVYAEMGSAWLLVMNDVNAAGHYLGKLLKYLGEDHVVFGSECVWFNSPQPQIEALRTFQIPKELRDQYGYPEITDRIRAKIFGLTAAGLFGVDPLATRNAVDQSKLTMLKQELDGEAGGRRWAFQPLSGPRSRREFLNLIKWRKHLRVPA